ncbi:hypothetical protein [Streptomyces sp. 3214.6]|nr:hypothetical protein [Streptomyces sp. 3214.6]SHI48085.1 hypothetical protein SAMN05444521_7658 [Streptomyces sp. 3214.6]
MRASPGGGREFWWLAVAVAVGVLVVLRPDLYASATEQFVVAVVGHR